MGVIGAGISINGPSGIDDASIIDQLTALEQQKVTTVQTQVSQYQVQISAYSKLKSDLAAVQTAVNALNSDSAFDVFTSQSSDSSVATVQGADGAEAGQYNIGVYQLATAETMISKDNLITSQTNSLASQGITVGDISIDGTKITIDANDTIQDVRSKINNATDSQGNPLNVSASVLQVSSSDYRLVLTAKNTGSTGVDYQDVTGSTLENLGIISGSSGTVAQAVTSQNPFLTDFNALLAGAAITYNGTDHNGNAVSNTFTKTANDTSVNDFLTQIGATFGGTASVNSNGNLVITDGTLGTSSLAVSSFSSTNNPANPLTTYSMNVTTQGDNGVAQQLTSQSPIAADFDSLADGATIQFSGLNNSGKQVTDTFTKTTGNETINDFLTKIGSDFGATATIDSNGNLVLTDNTQGTSQLSLSSLTANDSANYAFSATTSGAQIGDKGNIAQVLQSQDDIQTAFDALAAGSAIQYTGLDHNGNTVTNTYYKTTATTSISDFLAQVNNTFYGEATATIGTDGTLTLTDNEQGKSQLALTSLSIGGVSHTVSTVTPGKQGQGVLMAGQNAYFSYDGLMLNSASNNPDNFISGLTIQLHKAAPAETVQTSIAVDSATIQKNIQTVLDAYNTLLTDTTAETKPADPNDSTSKAGDLVNDMTVSSIMDQVRNTLLNSVSAISGPYNSLTMIGVNSDPDTGQLSIDQTQFTKALSANFDEVKSIFVTTGISSNANISYGRNTTTTQSGVYTLNEPDPNHLNIQLAGDSTWYTSDSRNGDIVTFSSGPASGLSITAPSGTIGTGNSSTFTFSMGLSDQLSNLIDTFDDPSTGMIATTQSSLQDQITDGNSRISDLQEQVNEYHDQLVQQFAQMEEALNTMKNQYNQMASALGLAQESTSSSSSS